MDGEIRGGMEAFFLLLFQSTSLTSCLPGICNQWQEGKMGGGDGIIERWVFQQDMERFLKTAKAHKTIKRWQRKEGSGIGGGRGDRRCAPTRHASPLFAYPAPPLSAAWLLGSEQPPIGRWGGKTERDLERGIVLRRHSQKITLQPRWSRSPPFSLLCTEMSPSPFDHTRSQWDLSGRK